MQSSKGTLKDRLSRYRQIKISVIGRKSGRTISTPVCEKFREKYGPKDVKKYDSRFDVAVLVELQGRGLTWSLPLDISIC